MSPRRRRGAGAAGTAQLEGYTLAQLAQSVGLSAHALRHWSKSGLLPPTRFRGPYTRYTREHLVYVRAIARLRYEQHLTADRIRQRLRELGAAGIAALADLPPETPAPPDTPATTPAPTPTHGAPAPAPSATAPGAPTPTAPIAGPTPSVDGVERYQATAARPREHWERIAVCPGVELHVRHDADTEAARIARAIVERFAIPPG